MIKSALYAAIGFAAISSMALAQSAGSSDDRDDLVSATALLPPGTFTTSAHSDEWKIENGTDDGTKMSVHERALVSISDK